MKVFKITFFFLLSTMMFVSCNTEVEQPVTKMDNADREFLEKLSQNFVSEITIGMPKHTVDSILLSCGFQYYEWTDQYDFPHKKFAGVYEYNTPSLFFSLWPYMQRTSSYNREHFLADMGIYVEDFDSIESIINKQYVDSVYRKGKIYAWADAEYDDSNRLCKFKFGANISPQLEEKRYIAKLFSNSLNQKLCDTIDNYFTWDARAFYYHSDYSYNFNNADKSYQMYYDSKDEDKYYYQPQQRDSYLEFIADKECFSLYERTYQRNSKEHIECTYNFRFYNYEENRWGDAFYKSVAGFGFTYEGYLHEE